MSALPTPLPPPPSIAPAPAGARLRLVGAGGNHPLPAAGVVLLATPAGVGALAAQVRSLDPAPALAGWVGVGAGQEGPSVDEVAWLGAASDLARLHARHRFRAAVVSLPRALDVEAAKLRRLLDQLGIPAAFVPMLEELLGPAGGPRGGVAGTGLSLGPAPVVDLAGLVGRRPRPIDRDAIAGVLAGKRVLVTGAGGSIGSELARIAAGFGPAELILMERAENALFEIDLQLARRFPDVPRRAILHDVVDAEQTLRHLVQTAPQVVFHAAAHKHVPLMEDHPAHAVTNNLFGTKAIADAAVAVGAERFVLISTDKAVNPTSVMGATKRLAEVYVRWLGGRAGTPTRCSMVRFGNVLGSACSVLTIWSQQVAEGGPITVTDPRMTRYFMTIPEAAALVIQSAAIAPDGARGAPVYVLDMGPPVRILDLAERFVRAHGLVPRIVQGPGAAPPSRDGPAIDIVMTGARPGEKLHEELAYPAEALGGTPFPGINAWAGPAPEGQDPLGVTQMVAELSMVRHGQDRAAVLAALRRHVPGLRPGEG